MLGAPCRDWVTSVCDRRQLVCGWKGRQSLYLGFKPVVLLPSPLLLLPFIVHFHKLEIVLAISLLRVGQEKLKL